MDQPKADRDVIDELTSLADELLDQAAEVRRQWTELAEALGAEPAAGPGPGPVPDAGGDVEASEADAVKLVALDMMLAGGSREEVREHLRETFGEADREAVLDEVFTQFGE